ncbi:esterase-like activity of phytase family protein [Acuticoccus mangrovi]|uniref:Esterase-like activity of phytase family protein n=1 Tax=Acuticoccus mangrovi TaxID=2796142 RepID=A0A934IQR4_9HYPH|nr:esterase-like activity of phytase family protein [Acuticoccus mangrovi]MBJ3776325.1 esterase-like activity of phytase family protein [Acuticoccus mangrovi]
MLRTSLAVALAALLTAPALADDETVFPATLAGHAVIPALSLIAPPADAPQDAWISGKFTAGPNRIDTPMSVEGDTGAYHGSRKTGIKLPFIGQPLQGFSGFAMDRADDGSIIALTDNGFGSKKNSPDTLLFFHKLSPDYENGAMDVKETVFLSDPDKVVPFRIAYEGTKARYLTGSDFDIESIQKIGDTLWIGDEFGPYILSATLDGKITGVYPTMMGDVELKGPDNPGLTVPAQAGKDYRVNRSGGYEGMALQPGTGLLWGMLEKPLMDETGATPEKALTVLAFDPATKTFTGDSFKFPLAEGATAIGDFNFIDETRALVIERDNGEGDPSLECRDEVTAACFPHPAMVKRIVLIDTASVGDDGMVRRIGHIDLMNIDDPDGLARLDTAADRDMTGTYTLPFFTIEDVMKIDDTHILVGTDNNLPFSAGRQLEEAMNNEFVLLAVPELLAAK